ncbi:MAG: peptide-methionine (R)-S-oxide reductase MsrB [Planctomycetes bacterium]|nr:peptide-methionine (R)-S-oxide reductase MsrB [Planctomycetota bacterium]
MTPTTSPQDKPRTSASGHDLTPPSPDELQRLAALLSPDERRVLLHQGTEPAFCGGLLNNKKPGVYHCRLCDLPLFRSSAKFESGTGWPSFFEPFDAEHVVVRWDMSHGMSREEIVCGRCGGHLGHRFDDGPKPTGHRYCLNSASLKFVADGEAA